jgi:GT2 family glycosyltransferase
MTPTVTVCVVVKDRCVQMAECLDSIASQTALASGVDVLVIDNGSSDGTADMVRQRTAGFPVALRVLEVPGPLGRARNAAVQATTADVLVSTDSDCLPEPGWLAALLAGFAPGIDVVQGRTLPATQPAGRWPKTMRVEAWSDLYETCNIAYRTAALRQAGGFDETAPIYGEDTAAGWRVRRLGGRRADAHDAVVRHDVTYPGLRWHLRYARGHQVWPRLIREFPEMRKELLYCRLFLRRRSALFDLAVLGGVLFARRRVWGLLFLLPYARTLRPAVCADGARGLIDSVAYDAATAGGLIAGSAHARRAVL